MSVCPSVSLHGTTRLPSGRIFMKFLISVFLEKSAEKLLAPLKSDQNAGYFTHTHNTHFWSCLSLFFLQWQMFHTKAVQINKTHILWSVTFCFRKSCRLRENVEKYYTAGQAIDDSTAHAHSMPDTW